MDDESMWAADHVVTLTFDSAITIPETANEFAIKGNHLTLVKGNQFDGRAKTDPHKLIHKFLRICYMFKFRDTKNEVVRLMMFPLSLTGEAKTWLYELNEGTNETWDELQTTFISRFFPPALFERLLREIQAFSQQENESLTYAWLHVKEMLRICHGHNLSKRNIIKIFYHGLSKITQEVLKAAPDGIFLYKTPNQAYQLLKDKVLLKLDWAKNQKTKSSLKKTVAFANEELQSNAKKTKPDLDDDDIPMSREEEANLMQPFSKNHQASIRNLETNFDRLANKQYGRPSGSLPSNTHPNPKGHNSKAYQPSQAQNEHVNAVFTRSDMIRAIRINAPLIDILAGMPNYGKFLKELIRNKHRIEQIYAAFLSDESSAMIQNKVQPKLGDPVSFLIPCNFNKTFSCNALADLGASINLMPYSLHAKLSLKTLKPTKISVRLADRSFQYPVGIAENMLVEVVLKSLEEDFDALLDEGSKILRSIEGTPHEEEIFAEFDEFMAMTADENSDSESDTEEPPFEKITINTNYKIKTSLEEPPIDLELKPLPDNLEYVFVEEPSFLPNIISSQLPKEKKNKLVSVLKKHKQAFAWKTTDISGICPSFCKHKIQLLDDKKPVVEKQKRLNLNMQEVIKKEIEKLLDTGIIYPIVDSPWVSPIYCVPKKGGITVVTNKNDELVSTRTVTG
nr:DNA-directed DNA polymerase [Tanacetum cinerariifolium]